MNFEQKKAKLKRYRKLTQKRVNLKQDLEEFEIRALTRATHITPPSADDVVRSGGQSITKAEKYAEREEDYKLLRAEYDKISRECSKILRAIFNISDLDLQNVVYAYYVLGMSFKEISYSQHISEVTAKRWRDKGVNILNFKK